MAPHLLNIHVETALSALQRRLAAYRIAANSLHDNQIEKVLYEIQELVGELERTIRASALGR